MRSLVHHFYFLVACPSATTLPASQVEHWSYRRSSSWWCCSPCCHHTRHRTPSATKKAKQEYQRPSGGASLDVGGATAASLAATHVTHVTIPWLESYHTLVAISWLGSCYTLVAGSTLFAAIRDQREAKWDASGNWIVQPGRTSPEHVCRPSCPSTGNPGNFREFSGQDRAKF
jgi:hypothetical protein